LADFGSASQATSKRLNTTSKARGTESYRAPEVLAINRFNNRADIFALGCIIYEILTGRKLFPTDWSVLQHWEAGGSNLIPKSWPRCPPGTRLYSLGMLTSRMLDNDSAMRPAASQIKCYLRNIRIGLDPFTPSEDSMKENIYLEDSSRLILPDERPASIQTEFRKKPASRRYLRRPRRRAEVNTYYTCNYSGCDNAYGALNHLNTHVRITNHGPKREPKGLALWTCI
jgi:serine/threonine protein kinase